MFHACDEKFDITENIKNFFVFGELNKAVVVERKDSAPLSRGPPALAAEELGRGYHSTTGH